jgi:hypothetical protein
MLYMVLPITLYRGDKYYKHYIVFNIAYFNMEWHNN